MSCWHASPPPCALQIGVWNVASVPNGALAPTACGEGRPRPPAGQGLAQERKYSYLHTCQALLQSNDFASEARACLLMYCCFII